jgi:hypothetical protein
VKQFLTILLLFVYSLSSIGATVKTHLCAGKVQKCACMKPSKKDSCCSEKTTFIKKQDQHQSLAVQSINHFVQPITIPVDFYMLASSPIVDSVSKNSVHSTKGMCFSGPPIYQLDCQYLI